MYDPLRKELFMFGGTPSVEDGTARLADFWRLQIHKFASFSLWSSVRY